MQALLQGAELPEWSVLALYLVHLRHQPPDGPRAPYVALLPDTTGCVLEWSEQEVRGGGGAQLGQIRDRYKVVDPLTVLKELMVC